MSERRDVNLFILDVFEAIDKINSYVHGIDNEFDLKKDLPELKEIIKKIKDSLK